MGADQWFKSYQRPDDGIQVTGMKIWPTYDLHHHFQRPLQHVTRTMPSNRKYPSIRMSLPLARPKTYPLPCENVIKVGDVCKYAERERVMSSCEGRRRTVETGRRSVLNQLERSRPQSCISQLSRCNKPMLPRRSTMDSITMASSCDHSMRPTSVADSDVSSYVQQHCCELMGPSVCTECSKKNTILINRTRTESALSDYKLTTENIATVTMVQTRLPFLSSAIIQQQLDNGGICRLQRVNCWNRDKYKDEDEEDEVPTKVPSLALAKLKMKKVVKVATTPMYFSNIRALNHKIVSGTMEKDAGKFTKLKKEPKRSESPYPFFLSPKKNSLHTEPKYKAYFEPPLLEKENQTDPFAPLSVSTDDNDALLRQQPIRLDSDSESEIDCLSTTRLEDGNDVFGDDVDKHLEEDTKKAPYHPPLLPKESQIEEPSFFAGSVIPYTLPKRAPDKLEGFDINRLNGELTSSESENES